MELDSTKIVAMLMENILALIGVLGSGSVAFIFIKTFKDKTEKTNEELAILKPQIESSIKKIDDLNLEIDRLGKENQNLKLEFIEKTRDIEKFITRDEAQNAYVTNHMFTKITDKILDEVKNFNKKMDEIRNVLVIQGEASKNLK